MAVPVSFTTEQAPQFGTPHEVAEGIWLIRLPIALSMDHVNVYLLRDDEGLVLVDTGTNKTHSQQTLATALQHPLFNQLPLTKIIVTHYHPDHIGQAGHLAVIAADSPTLHASRTSWQTCRLLLSDNPPLPHNDHVLFYKRAGMSDMELESFKRRAPSSYADNVATLPMSYRRLKEAQTLSIGDRQWTVHMGNGHADEHVTLWSNDNIAIVGDQILPSISPNLTVHYTEPEADAVSEWLDSCKRFEKLAHDDTLCLPGHNRPFTGAPFRCRQLLENCQHVMTRIESSLTRAKTAMEIMPDIYRRTLAANERVALIGETVGYLNYLHNSGRVTQRLSKKGQLRWRRA